jgi:RND family efflux transporter MFP subunit
MIRGKTFVAIILLFIALPVSAQDWVSVDKQPLTEMLRLDGTVEAVRESTVSAQTSGTVTELPFDIDDRVEAGELIVRLDDSEQRSRLSQAESALEEARAELADAQQNFERTRSLYQRDVVSQSQLDQARNRLDAARARVSRTEAAVDEARQQLEYTRIKAPYTGIVTERLVELGESVSVGQPLMSGLSLEQLRVVVSIPQQYADRVRRQRNAVVTLDDGRRLDTGEMTFYPYADRSSHTFRLRVRLDEPEGSLYPGMLVRVEIPVAEREALWVPATSLYQRGELRAVYVQGADGKARLRQVRVGAKRDGALEILSGVSAGEQVLKEVPPE